MVHVSLTCNVKFIDDLFDFPSKPRQNRDIKDSMRQHETLSRGDLVLKSSGKRLLCTAVPFTISHCIIVEEYSINIPINATSQYIIRNIPQYIANTNYENVFHTNCMED